jgi:hypothetical protein
LRKEKTKENGESELSDFYTFTPLAAFENEIMVQNLEKDKNAIF